MPKLFTDEDKNILFEGVDIEDGNQTEFMVKMESMITSKLFFPLALSLHDKATIKRKVVLIVIIFLIIGIKID